MPTSTLQAFTEMIHERLPHLKGVDETRLFSVLMSAGVTIEFDFDDAGNTLVKHDEITDEVIQKLSV
jgi:hypothetical protein